MTSSPTRTVTLSARLTTLPCFFAPASRSTVDRPLRLRKVLSSLRPLWDFYDLKRSCKT